MADTAAATADAVDVDDSVARLERRLAREREKNAILETMIEDKTRGLYLAQAAVEKGRSFLESVLGCMQSAVFVTDNSGCVTSIGGTASALTGAGERELIGRDLDDLLRRLDGQEYELSTSGGPIPVLVTTSELLDDHDDPIGSVLVASDLRERRQLEVELRHTHRLESIGQLAAGVAHEINTPLQYVSDSAYFLGEILYDLVDLQDDYEELRTIAAHHEDCVEKATEIANKAEDIDLDFLRDEGPRAAQRTLDGLQRVTSIVRAMKQFAHPGNDDMAPTDLGQVIESTLTVARNEFKYVADVIWDESKAPEVYCNKGDLGQVLINIVVNAAQAIGDLVEGTGERGVIEISAHEDGDGVAIVIRDTGGGIPADIKERIFEPFFTTKEPGKGTGQGLALAHNVVVSKHGGRLTLDVEDGVGSTFTIWLPNAGHAKGAA